MRSFYSPYVPVAERRRKADKKIAALQKKGTAIEPVVAATPRGKIAASFWGQAWCEHLESYSDFANRLPRGRTYLRNGSVRHLGIEAGCIRALVIGSRLYEQTVRIEPLPKAKWEALKKSCQGKIGSLVELLRGQISDEIMAVVTDPSRGLFPAPKEIKLDCSCPDWAGLCKHLAAVLYGVGARLDEAPELLFKLRGVDHTELIQADAAALVNGTGRRRRLAPAAMADVFGVELDADTDAPAAAPASPAPSGPPESAATRQAAPSKKARSGKNGAATKTRASAKPRTSAKTKTKAKSKSPTRTKTKTKSPKPFQATGPAVKQLRAELGLSRNAFARRLGVSAPTVANWEIKRGKLNLQSRSLTALTDIHRATKKNQGG